MLNVDIAKVDASNLNFANTVKSLYLSEITSSSVKIKADGVTSLILCAKKKTTEVTLPSLSNLTSLSLENVKLSNFDGSECPKLTFLSLEGTQTTTVKGIEQMEDLVILYLHKTNVKSLNLSANKKLTHVYVHDNKQLTSIKMPNCASWVYVNDNNLKNIDLKGVAQLSLLDVSGNKNLKALNISGNKKLRLLLLNNTKISKLNTSKNPNLEELDCAKTRIKSLDISKNKKLSGLDISGNKSLKKLNINNNKKLSVLSYYGSGIKKWNLSKFKTITLAYRNIKKGTIVSLNNVIGNGYKATATDGGIKYDKKRNSFKVTKKGIAKLTLKKGKITRIIYVYNAK